MTRTWEVPGVVTGGFLVPLLKTGKPKELPASQTNYTFIHTSENSSKLYDYKREDRIQLSHAVHRTGRITTEHVFTCKTLAEKAVTSECYETTILLLDRSIAFDTNHWKKLMKILKQYWIPMNYICWRYY